MGLAWGWSEEGVRASWVASSVGKMKRCGDGWRWQSHSHVYAPLVHTSCMHLLYSYSHVYAPLAENGALKMLPMVTSHYAEGDDRGWHGWMASPTPWTWVWASSRTCWWTGKPGVLQSMGSHRVRHDWATELNWLILFHNVFAKAKILILILRRSVECSSKKGQQINLIPLVLKVSFR